MVLRYGYFKWEVKMIIKKEFVILFLFSTGYMLSVAGTRPILPLFASYLETNNTIIGLLVAAFSFLPLFFSISFGKIIDKMGVYIPLLIAVILAILGLSWPFFQGSLIGLLFSQIITGTSQVIFMITMQIYAGHAGSEQKRGIYITAFSIGIAIGGFIGPSISGLISDYFGYHMAFLTLGLFLLLLVPLAPLIKSNKGKVFNKTNIPPNKTRDLFKIYELRQAILVSTLIILGKDIYLTFFPLLAEDKGLPISLIGIIVSINTGAGILIRFLLTYILSSSRKETILTITLIIMGIFYIVISFAHHLFLLFTVSFILGICVGLGQPITITKTLNCLPYERMGEGLGLRVSINRFSQVIHPIILGFSSAFIGLTGVFTISGIFFILATVGQKGIHPFIKKITP